MLNTHATNRSNEAAQGEQPVCAVSDILSAAKRSQRAYGLLALRQPLAVSADCQIDLFRF
jgi:pyruvate kinase